MRGGFSPRGGRGGGSSGRGPGSMPMSGPDIVLPKRRRALPEIGRLSLTGGEREGNKEVAEVTGRAAYRAALSCPHCGCSVVVKIAKGRRSRR